MKKVSNCFADSKIIPIFATAILENRSGNAHFDILHDRLTSFDLVKSGKLEIGVKTSLVKPVLYPDEGHGLSYYICDTGFSRTLLGKYVERTCPSLFNVKLKNFKNYVREN